MSPHISPLWRSFFVIRALGILWYTNEYLYTSFPVWAELLFLTLVRVIDMAFTLKALTPMSWLRSFVMAGVARIPLYWYDSPPSHAALEMPLAFVFAFLSAYDKALAVGYVAVYAVAIYALQAAMMMGAGYPMLSSYSPTWRFVLMADFHMVLLGMALLRMSTGVLSESPRGRFAIWVMGIADTIGRVVYRNDINRR